MITMVFSVSAIRGPVVRFIVEVYEKFSAVFFHGGEEEQTPPVTLEVLYEPTWLPEGYVLDDKTTTTSETIRSEHFINGKNAITFRQHTLSAGINLDTEGIEIQSVLVHGRTAILYNNKGVWTLIWDNSQYGFALSGPVNANDLLRMAESLREK